MIVASFGVIPSREDGAGSPATGAQREFEGDSAPSSRCGMTLEAVLARRECVIAIGEGELRGDALACALYSDYFVMRDDATLIIDTPRAWSGVVWRLWARHSCLALLASGQTRMSASHARRHALCDALDVEWIGSRSAIALDSAASLIGRRGGDALERAEFARLFATGEPQLGLTAFLKKRDRTGGKNDER